MWLCGSFPSEWGLVDDITDTRDLAAIRATSAPERVTVCECRELEMSRMSAPPALSWAAVITATCGSGWLSATVPATLPELGGVEVGLLGLLEPPPQPLVRAAPPSRVSTVATNSRRLAWCLESGFRSRCAVWPRCTVAVTQAMHLICAPFEADRPGVGTSQAVNRS
jgi:hypothetical protein